MSQKTTETLADHLPLMPDIRAERLAELNRLFPELFTNNGRLNPDELKQLIAPNEVRDSRRSTLVCLAQNESIKDTTIKRLRDLTESGESPFFICLERSLSTTSKWNLRHFLGKHYNAF